MLMRWEQVNMPVMMLLPGKSFKLNVVGPSVSTASPNEEDNTEEEPEVDFGNITNSYIVPTTPNTRIHKDHPIDNVIGEVQSTVQTRRMLKLTSKQGFLSVWILVDLPNGNKAIGTKWVFKNKKDERGIVIRNKARDQNTSRAYQKWSMDTKILSLVGPPDNGWCMRWSSNKELGDRMERVATTASSLEAAQDSGSGPRCQDTILGDVNAQTRFEITSKQSIDPPLSRGYTLGSGEDSMKLIGIECENFVHNCHIKTERVSWLKLVLSVFVSAVKRMLMLPVQVFAVESDSINTLIKVNQVWGMKKPAQSLTFIKPFFSSGKYLYSSITQCLSAKSTAWNEFSSSMASLIICLATNQKFNLSKYIFDAMRAGKDLSRRITPLFDTMMVQPVEEMGGSKTGGQRFLKIDGRAEACGKVLDLQKAKDAQAKEIAALQKRIQIPGEVGAPEVESKRGEYEDIDADVDVSLVDETLRETKCWINSKKPDVVLAGGEAVSTVVLMIVLFVPTNYYDGGDRLLAKRTSIQRKREDLTDGKKQNIYGTDGEMKKACCCS
ncbi:hypothetical protein Tco_0269447 [Tanacetum coccineum]